MKKENVVNTVLGAVIILFFVSIFLEDTSIKLFLSVAGIVIGLPVTIMRIKMNVIKDKESSYYYIYLILFSILAFVLVNFLN
jgi:hypothetical protein